ncbi:[NiFe]-hydrogenase assembly chaperone HybE [Vibrio sp. RC27]
MNSIENPSVVVTQVFNNIYHTEMKALPFVNTNLSVECIGFALHEENWLGVLLTPWCMDLLLFPGPGREWSQSLNVGDKMGLTLGENQYTFFASYHEELGQYLSCSLCSPVKHLTTHSAAKQLAIDIRRLIVALPLDTVDDKSRRQLFTKLVNPTPAL